MLIIVLELLWYFFRVILEPSSIQETCDSMLKWYNKTRIYIQFQTKKHHQDKCPLMLMNWYSITHIVIQFSNFPTEMRHSIWCVKLLIRIPTIEFSCVLILWARKNLWLSWLNIMKPLLWSMNKDMKLF